MVGEMDVEKRMNLSLDDIIKEKGKAKPKRSAGTQNGSVKGRGKVKIANLSSQVSRRRPWKTVQVPLRLKLLFLTLFLQR